jgi:DNA-binding ferritin-like protein (Dps family)
MTTIQLKLPESVARFYPKVGEKIFLQALNESVRRLIDEERSELKQTKARIRRYERKYKCNFKAFEKRLSSTGNYETHEDYGEWSYLEDKVQLISEDIANYERLAAA